MNRATVRLSRETQVSGVGSFLFVSIFRGVLISL